MTRVGIVGYGRFGRALAELAARRGKSVVAFDPYAAPHEGFVAVASTLRELAGRADVIVVATPVEAMRAVFAELVEATASATTPPLVMDVGSVKVVPSRALTETFGDDARVLATHPLFGPTSIALAERPLRVVVCPAARQDVTTSGEEFWTSLGCETLRVSAEEHDRVMARTHALAFFFAKGLIDAGLDKVESFSPPSFQALARSVESVRADAGHLFHTIEVDNPFAAEMRSTLLAALAGADAALTTATAKDASIPPIAMPPPEGAARTLAVERARIDDLDRELVALLARRAELAERVAAAKTELGVGVRDATREAEVFASRKAWAQAAGLDPDAVADVFAAILRFSRVHQAKR